MRRDGGRWYEALRALCEECRASASAHTAAVLFYLARWCQKTTKAAEPEVEAFPSAELRQTAERIADNLAHDGATVDRLVEGDKGAWDDLGQVLLGSARRRVGDGARDYVHEAAQKIAVVLLTGTPPSRAPAQLERGPKGPTNEYVFTAPFDNWARTVVIRLIVDDQRRTGRERTRAEQPDRQPRPSLDTATLRECVGALPGLVQAIRVLPAKQRDVFVLTLRHCELDELVHRRLHELAPDLFSEAGGEPVTSDADIARRLGTKARNVTANRSAARRKLARQDHRWALLLDALMPHRSTRPLDEGRSDG